MVKRKDPERLFNEGDVIAVPVKGKGDEVTMRPALITRVGGDGTIADRDTVYYLWLDSKGETTGGGHHFSGEWAMKDVKKIDFAKVRTVVDLPPDWQKMAFDYEVKTKGAKDERAELLGEWEPETHPSYGSIQVSRVSGHAALFGSPFRHMHYMTISIGRAERQRSTGRDWHFSGMRGELIQIAMSEAQWARFVSSAGIGGGTPCTLDYVGGQRQQPCPEQQEVERFHEDIDRDVKAAMKFMKDAEDAMRELADDKAPTKEKRKKVAELLSTARRKLDDSAPFVAKQLRERMDTIVQEGKTEIEAFAHNTLVEGGIAALAQTLGKEAKVLDMGKPPPAEKLVEGKVEKKGDKS
jgi:hypothetical protein